MKNSITKSILAATVVVATMLSGASAHAFSIYCPMPYQNGGYFNSQTSGNAGGYQNSWNTPYGNSSAWSNYSNSQSSANWGNYGMTPYGMGHTGGYSNSQTQSSSSGYSNNYGGPGFSGSNWGTSYSSSTSSSWGNYAY